MVKWVPVHPSSAALWFIRSANPWILPPTCSASPLATSLADFSRRPYKQSRTDTRSPSWRFKVTAPDSRFVTAVLENTTVSFRSAFSSTRRAVISFVMLAGYSFSSAFFSNSTVLWVASKRMAASADTAGMESSMSWTAPAVPFTGAFVLYSRIPEAGAVTVPVWEPVGPDWVLRSPAWGPVEPDWMLWFPAWGPGWFWAWVPAPLWLSGTIWTPWPAGLLTSSGVISISAWAVWAIQRAMASPRLKIRVLLNIVCLPAL